MCAVITAGACAARATKGTSSSARSAGSDLSTRGSAWCESTWVSPWPGKCFTQQATPSRAAPRIQAPARRATACGSLPKLRSAMTGLAGLLFTSTTGAKFQFTPRWRRPRATAAPTCSASRSSPIAPSAIAAGAAGRQVARATEPPSWSMAISAPSPMAWRSSVVSCRISASLPRFLRNRQTARMRSRRRKAAVAASRLVPSMSTITRRPGSIGAEFIRCT